MKAPEQASIDKCVRRQTDVRPRLAWRICFLRRLFLLGLVLSATVALIPSRPSAVRAVTCTTNPVVTNNGDSGAGTLRQAIMDACDGGTVTFGNTVMSPITLTSGELVISKNLTISGPGASLLTVQRSTAGGTPAFSIFTVGNDLTVNISGLTITNGAANNGGGIFNSTGGALTVNNSTISGNSATEDGGGIYNSISGTVTLTGSTVSGNSATGDGGGIFNEGDTVTLTNSTISTNQAGNNMIAGNGGGIFNDSGTVTLTSSIISGNQLLGSPSGGDKGGGLFNTGGTVTLTNSTISGNSAPLGQGGGICTDSGTVTLTNSTISANQAINGFGNGISNSGGKVTLNNSTISGNQGQFSVGGGIYNNNGGTVTLTGSSSITGNTAAGSGGGIYNNNGGKVTLNNSTISGNKAFSLDGGGGGIYSNSGGIVTLTGSTISGNQAANGGGGIYSKIGSTVMLTNSTISGNQATNSGGGLFNSGTVTLTNSTISGNQATNLGGGGIYNTGGTVTLINSTISGNHATVDNGGGIFNDSIVTMTNSTISANQATFGGGIFNDGGSTVRASIIAGNSATNGPDVDGTFTSAGFNLIGETDGSTGFTQSTDQTGTIASPLDPKLGPLQNYGGPTFTHALLSGSPAIDAGDDSVLNSPLFLMWDQRGPEFARKVGAHVDIGAFEFGAVMCPVINASVSGGGFIASGASSTVTVTVTGGVAPYTVTLTSGGGTMTGPSPLTFMVHPSMNTTYSVASGTDADGCPITGTGSATVTVLDTCLKDNSTGNLLQWNSTTGQYRFTRCSDGFMLTGTGTPGLVNGIRTLTDFKTDRRISAGFNTGQLTGNATLYLMVAQGVWQSFQIVDTNPSAVCKC